MVATGGLCVVCAMHVGPATTPPKVQVTKERNLTYPILMRVLVCGQCGGMLVGGCTGRMPVATSSCNTDTFEQINKCIVARADTIGCLVYADQDRLHVFMRCEISYAP